MAQFENPPKTIGVYTSGGDAPGMNAAIRSVVRCGVQMGLNVVGISHGYEGLLSGDSQPLEPGSVANLLQRGGTFLKAGRCQEFFKPQVRALVPAQMKKMRLDALICIGGDGSFSGAHLLWNEHKIPIVGVPGTIDNDIYGSQSTIGFDTALNTALDAIDRIRDTAASHDRLFIVEVMGRNSGFIAVDVGLAGGAEEVFTPDHPVGIEDAIAHIKRGMQRGKTSSILVTAEGQKPGRAYDLAEAIRKRSGFDAKVCILGHVQRGGSPSAWDRILASRMGFAAVKALKSQMCDVMIGLQNQDLIPVEFAEALNKKKAVSTTMVELARILST